MQPGQRVVPATQRRRLLPKPTACRRSEFAAITRARYSPRSRARDFSTAELHGSRNRRRAVGLGKGGALPCSGVSWAVRSCWPSETDGSLIVTPRAGAAGGNDFSTGTTSTVGTTMVDPRRRLLPKPTACRRSEFATITRARFFCGRAARIAEPTASRRFGKGWAPSMFRRLVGREVVLASRDRRIADCHSAGGRSRAEIKGTGVVSPTSDALRRGPTGNDSRPLYLGPFGVQTGLSFPFVPFV